MAVSRFPLGGMIAAVLALSLGLMPAAASGASNPAAFAPIQPASGALRAGTGIPGAGLDVTGKHYVYADDGLSSNNTIDEYSATRSGLTHLGTVPTGGYASGLAFGQNDIAVHGNCLVHSDSGGTIQSYAINGSTGLLTQVSIVIPGGGFHPGDTKISASGSDVYVSGGIGELVTIPLGSDCSLGNLSTVTTPNAAYYSIALPDATHLLAVNINGSNDIYTISGGATLTLEASNPSSIGSPDGAAAATLAGKTYTFNGQAVVGPPKAEAHILNPSSGILAPAPGSPQTDGNSGASDGPNLNFSPAYSLLTQTNVLSNTVAAYSMAGGTLAYQNSATLDPSSIGPVAQTSLSKYLGVLSYQSGTIDVCLLATTGVSLCRLVATVSGAGSGSDPGGIGVK